MPQPARNRSLSPPRHEELRQATRFRKEPDTEFAVILLPDGPELLAEVHDESLTGLGLIVADASQLAAGCRVTIVYRRELLDATLRHVSARPDGTFLAGFECRRATGND
jgi:hypothetical protein